jgi:hypothetical protein
MSLNIAVTLLIINLIDCPIPLRILEPHTLKRETGYCHVQASLKERGQAITFAFNQIYIRKEAVFT